ncbi:MAG: hypothetical protein Q4D66_04715 [Bacteroidales bacterium]|nr:hypothetical protein [Bacteroidales bacterium]
MKKIAYLFALLVLTACGSEAPIVPHIDYANEFTIQDNPSDPVQHERYAIFKEFGVPVYLNDTIAIREKGSNYDGTPRKIYETVDLNWTFSGYDRGVKYTYDYLTNPDEQLRSLQFVRFYLKTTPKGLRPFSIMLADTLTATSNNKVEKPIYHVGFRTLVFAQIKDITSEDSIKQQVDKVIKNMITDRVSANKTVCARFANVSSEKGWYQSSWTELGNCPTLTKWQSKTWALSPNALYNEPPYVTYDGEDFVTLLLAGGAAGESYVGSLEEAEAIRQEILNEMGNYGFIRGWKHTGVESPGDDKEDREYFLQAIIHLGDKGFRARYGNSKLVMEKYNILANFIVQELGYSLDYDGRPDANDANNVEPTE